MSYLPPARPDRTHAPPPRPTQLPAIRRCHMPHASAHAVSPHAPTARTHLHRAPHSYPRYHRATCRTRRRTPHRHSPRPHVHAPPPRPTQLPAIRRCHMPHASAHAVSPHAPTARTAPHRAPHSYPRYHPCHMPHTSAHDASPHATTARTAPHHAPHSYPRYDGATCRTRRRMTHRHTLRPHDPSWPPMRTPGGHTLRLRDGGGSACCALRAQQWRFMAAVARQLQP